MGIRADNPGLLTLSGTNTWVVGRDPAWVIDPGPPLDSHLAALTAEIERRGGLGGVLLTHSHADHSGGLAALLDRLPAAAAAYDFPGTLPLREGDTFGPFSVFELPGHAPDHLVFLFDGVAFTGDAVLGEGSVFISPGPGSLAGYLEGLVRLRERAPAFIAPGHGPLVEDPDAKLSHYIAHRLDRERRLAIALNRGARSSDELLDTAWPEIPSELRFAAMVTLAAHLEKLDEEGRLPDGVQRPEF